MNRFIRSLFPILASLFILFVAWLALPNGTRERTQLPQVRLVASPGTYQNTKPGVQYIGTEACIDCHKDQHATYLQTTHSRTAQVTNTDSEPATGSYRHPHSGHLYEAIHRDGELLHREIRHGANGQVSGTTEAVIGYSIGSGTHGKSYVFQKDGHWGQSPISWFQETQRWGMSPGYDHPLHPSFNRKLDSRCFFCHVGSVDRKEKNPFQFEIVEETIGCERCHGPGELHAEKHRHQQAVSDFDDTIVNPEKLSRELSEAICHQCHLQGVMSSEVSGKHEWDYRPGLPLTAFRADYQYRLGDDSMKIVGHVEQMHQSECYRQTETLTCITCHDPHDVPASEQKVDFYRSVCLKCHEDQACGKPHDERIEIAGNDCAKCHMPAATTNVPHTAFHHHRIGIHTPAESNAREVIAGLSPVIELSILSKLEQDRCGALAKAQIFRDQRSRPEFAKYGIEAAESLIRLKQAGKDDAHLNVMLAWLADDQGQKEIAAMLAEHARGKEPAPTLSRIEATRMLAQRAFRAGNKDQAVQLFRELTTYTRDGVDTYYLGLCEQNVGNTEDAIKALKKSIDIDPTQESAHVALEAIYHSTDRPTEAASHRRLAMENQIIAEKLQAKAAKLAGESDKP